MTKSRNTTQQKPHANRDYEVLTRALDLYSDDAIIHYEVNDDLPVLLKRGGHDTGTCEGYVLVRLKLDSEKTDAVELYSGPSDSYLDTLNQALEVMTTIRDVVVRQGATL